MLKLLVVLLGKLIKLKSTGPSLDEALYLIKKEIEKQTQ